MDPYMGGNSTVIMDNTNNETLLQNHCLNLQDGDISYLRNLDDSEFINRSSGKKRVKSSKRNSSNKYKSSKRKQTSGKQSSERRPSARSGSKSGHKKSP